MRVFPPPRWAVAADTAAIVVFAVIGNLSHHGGVTLGGLARDVLPLLGGWLAAGALFGLYTQPSPGRLAATWLSGVTVGVTVRSDVINHTDAGKEAAFLTVALIFTLLFALAARAATAWVLPRARTRARRRASP